ncbi:Zinc finger MYM-type protein 1 [Holothuria leucospilota]|uniref:Zinc finger MYM-type protein 1 n=1 Tax=Holothuria leucospilota TaxID=206669 RepID=A0A9Q1HJI7_HOLLE|nr:Zinc finger MYM-type protein 1 [Holothuria leucospilota]
MTASFKIRGQILELLGRYDDTIKKHLENSARNTSPDIQNDILSSAQEVILKEISLEVNDAPFVSVIMDEATDVTHHEQAAIIVRYVDKDMTIQEHLIWVTAVENTPAENLRQTLLGALKMVEIDTNKIVSQCYDGAANMRGGISGVQSRLKEIQPRAIYVHCFGHCLNLVIADAMAEVQSTRNFFGSVQSIYNFIKSSPHRHAILESVMKRLLTDKRIKTLKSLSETRWTCRAEAVNSIAENLQSILQALEEITERTTRPRSEDLDLVTALETVASLKENLLQMRGDEEASAIFSRAKTLCDGLCIDADVPRRPRKVSRRIDDCSENEHEFTSAQEEWKVRSYFQVIDKAVADIDRRFNQEATDIIRTCGKILRKEKPSDDFNKIAAQFDVPPAERKTEFELYATDEGISQANISLPGLLKHLQTSGRDNVYKCLSKVLIGFASMPVTSSSAERAFSKMGIIKSKLRSAMTQTNSEDIVGQCTLCRLTSIVNMFILFLKLVMIEIVSCFSV